MKTLTTYIHEMNRIYEFAIKIAGCDYDKDREQQLKSALGAYVVESVGSAKRLPIREHADFPGMGPCECYLIEVAVRYPVVTDQVAKVVAEKLGISRKQVLVRTKGQEEIYNSFYEPKTASDGSVLNNPVLDDVPGGQEVAGQARRDSLLKELETRKYEFAAKASAAPAADMPMGNISPVGSKQNKIPSPVKGK